jgi:hypothetical protein
MTGGSAGQARNIGTSDAIALAGLSVTLAAVAFYAIGWMYASRFLEHFGIGLLGLDLPKESFFVFGAWVLAGNVHFLLLIVAGTILLWRGLRVAASWLAPARPLFARLYGPEGRMFKWTAICSGLIIGLFLLLRALAFQAAAIDAQNERATGFASRPAVEVWLTTPPQGGPAGLTSACYRLFLRAKDAIVLIRPQHGEPAATMPSVVIPSSQIAALRLTTVRGPCP